MDAEGDQSWEPTPSYVDLVQGIVDVYNFASSNRHQAAPLYSYWTFVTENSIGPKGLSAILLVTFALTWLRRYLTANVLQPVCHSYRLNPRNHDKITESSWKLIFYVLAWIIESYLSVVKYGFFQRPSIMFSDLDNRTSVPWDIELLYCAQMSYYLHALYSVFFVDIWKKDSVLMAFHHIMTIILLAFSYLMKCTEVGLMILLFHDCCDVFLEASKVIHYLKIQNGRLKPKLNKIAEITFAFFIVTWVLSRLYCYPLRVIHTTSLSITKGDLHKKHFIYPAYIQSCCLLAINAYWTVLIFNLVVKVRTGKMEELDDIRDYDVHDLNLPKQLQVNKDFGGRIRKSGKEQ